MSEVPHRRRLWRLQHACHAAVGVHAIVSEHRFHSGKSDQLGLQPDPAVYRDRDRRERQLRRRVAGAVTLAFTSDDAFALRVGNGATAASGAPQVNVPTNTAFGGLPVMGGVNQRSAEATNSVTVNFPAPGAYPYEVEYSKGGDKNVTLTMLVNGADPADCNTQVGSRSGHTVADIADPDLGRRGASHRLGRDSEPAIDGECNRRQPAVSPIGYRRNRASKVCLRRRSVRRSGSDSGDGGDHSLPRSRCSLKRSRISTSIPRPAPCRTYPHVVFRILRWIITPPSGIQVSSSSQPVWMRNRKIVTNNYN